MKVELLQASYGSNDGTRTDHFDKGVHDVSDDLAKLWIQEGVAVALGEAKSEEPAETKIEPELTNKAEKTAAKKAAKK